MNLRGYKVYLLIVGLFLFGCESKIDYITRTDFHYINGTADPIRIELKGGRISNFITDTIFYLPSGDSLVIRVDGESTDKDIKASDYKWSALVADTTKAVFHDTLCYKEFGFSGPILQSTASHTYEQKAWNYFVFRYRIDNGLLNMASKCQ